jgi:hypothetical protein
MLATAKFLTLKVTPEYDEKMKIPFLKKVFTLHNLICKFILLVMATNDCQLIDHEMLWTRFKDNGTNLTIYLYFRYLPAFTLRVKCLFGLCNITCFLIRSNSLSISSRRPVVVYSSLFVNK